MKSMDKDKKAYKKYLDGMNESDRLVENLNSGVLTITSLETAYRAHITQRKDLPEEVRNLLTGIGEPYMGCLRFATEVRKLVGSVKLSYLRGKQHEEENKLK